MSTPTSNSSSFSSNGSSSGESPVPAPAPGTSTPTTATATAPLPSPSDDSKSEVKEERDDEHDDGDEVAPQPPRSDDFDSTMWAQIFDETHLRGLDVDDEPMEDVSPPVTRVDPRQSLYRSERMAVASVLDPWPYEDEEMATPNHEYHRPHSLELEPSPILQTPTYWSPGVASMMTRELSGGFQDSSPQPGVQPMKVETRDRPQGAGVRQQLISFKPQGTGQPFALSKPILRDDGALLVGTESAHTPSEHRIFVTNFRTWSPSSPVPFLPVRGEVRDLEWISPCMAIAAIGSDIHLLQVGDEKGGRRCQLLDPISPVHSDTIREIAVNCTRTTPLIASGGFDETVVVLDLGQSGPSAGPIRSIAKFDACDVVSSLRWKPRDASQISWTTDGGDFQVADLRARSTQFQVPLYSLPQLAQPSGLFSHEYLSDHTVVLGYEHGGLAYIDLRMARHTSCYDHHPSPLRSISDLRRSNMGKLAIFGLGGFSLGRVNATGRGLEQLPRSQVNHDQAISQSSYRTCGAFCNGSEQIMAVSDSCGLVAIYGIGDINVHDNSHQALV